MQPVRKLMVGLAVVAGTVGLGASLAIAQTDTTTPPSTEAPAAPPSTEAPAQAPRDRDCPEKDGRGNRGGDSQNGSTNAAYPLTGGAV